MPVLSGKLLCLMNSGESEGARAKRVRDLILRGLTGAIILALFVGAIASAGSVLNAHMSDAPDGDGVEEFPSETSVVYLVFEYRSMQEETVEVRVFQGSNPEPLIHIENTYSGSGTDSIQISPEGAAFADGTYATNLYMGGYVIKTILWRVTEETGVATATPTETPVTGTPTPTATLSLTPTFSPTGTPVPPTATATPGSYPPSTPSVTPTSSPTTGTSYPGPSPTATFSPSPVAAMPTTTATGEAVSSTSTATSVPSSPSPTVTTVAYPAETATSSPREGEVTATPELEVLTPTSTQPPEVSLSPQITDTSAAPVSSETVDAEASEAMPPSRLESFLAAAILGTLALFIWQRRP